MGNPYDIADDDPDYLALHERFGTRPMQAPQKDIGGAIAAGKQAIGSTLKGFGQLGADWVPGVGQDNALKRYGAEVEAANPTRVHGFGDFAEAPVTGLKEIAGQSLGPMGLAAGISAVGTGIGMIPHPVAQIVGRGLQALGPLAVYGAPSQSGIYESQKEQNPEFADSLGGKLLRTGAAATVGQIERAFGPQKVGEMMLSKEGRAAAAKMFAAKEGEGFAKTLGRGMLRTGLEEGGEELMQNPIEQAAGLTNPLSAKNLQDTAWGAASGFMGGGMFGAAGGVHGHLTRPSGEKPLTEDRPTNLLGAPVAGQQLDLPFGMAEQKQFGMPFDQDTEDANAALAGNTVLPEQKSQQDWVAIRQLRDRAEAAAAQADAFMVDGDEPGAASMQAQADALYKQADKATAKYVKTIAEANQKAKDAEVKATETGVTAARKVKAEKAQGTLPLGEAAPTAPLAYEPTEVEQAARDSDIPDAAKVRLFRKDGKLRDHYAKRVMQWNDWADADLLQAHTNLANDFDAKKAIGTMEANRMSILEALLRNRGAEFTSYAESSAARAATAPVAGQGIAEAKANAKEPSAVTNIDPATYAAQTGAPVAPAPMAAPTDLLGGNNLPATVPTPAGPGLAPVPVSTEPSLPVEVNLPDVQQRVFDHVINAMQNNELDTVLDADNKFMWAQIGRALNLGRDSVMMAMNAIQPHLAKALGAGSVAEVKAQQGTRNVEEADATQLGLAPKDQRTNAIAEEDLFGGGEESAVTQGMGIISGPGGSQANIFDGDEVKVPEAWLEPTEADKARDAKRAVDARKEADVRQKVKRAPEAMSTWDEYAESTTPQGTPFHELAERTMALWLLEYDALIEKHGHRPWAQLEPMIAKLYNEYATDTWVNQNEQGKVEATGRVRQTENLLPAGETGARSLAAESQAAAPEPAKAPAEQVATESAPVEVMDNDVANMWDEATAPQAQKIGETGSVARLGRNGAPVPAADQLSTEQLTQTIDEFFRGFKTRVPVLVEASEAGVVPDGKPGGASGAIYNGNMYLFRDGIRSVAEAVETLWHEVFHFGLRRFMTEAQYISKMNELANRDSGISAYATVWSTQEEGKALKAQGKSDSYIRARGADEALAIISEQQKGPLALTQKMTFMLTRWLASVARTFSLHKVAGRINNMNNAEARLFVNKTLGMLRSGATPAQNGTDFTADPAFSKVNSAAAAVAGTNNAVKTNFEKQTASAIAQLKEGANRALHLVAFTRDLVDIAHKEGLTTARNYYRLSNMRDAEQTRIESEVDRILTDAYKLSKGDRKNAQDFIKKSTIEQKWGFAPSWKKDAVVDPEMKKLFDKEGYLSTDAREVVKQLFKHADTMHKQLQGQINAEIDREYDKRVKAALDAGNDGKAREIERDRKRALSVVGRKLPEMQGPYAPLKRFGNHVFVGKSQRYLDAEREGDKKEIARLIKLREGDYEVTFFDTKYQAELYDRENQHRFARTDNFNRMMGYDKFKEVPWGEILKIKTAIESEIGELKGKNEMQRLVTDLYISMLSDASARKTELRREGVEGASDEMFRAFATKGRADAHFFAALKHNGGIQRAISDMRMQTTQGDKDGQLTEPGQRGRRALVFDEIIKRHAQQLNYTPTPFADKAMRFTSWWMLLTSPGYYIQNALQVGMLTLPVLAGSRMPGSTNLIGAKAAASALTRAYGNGLAKAVLAAGNTLDTESLEKRGIITPAERRMLDTLIEQGKVDITIAQDLGRAAAGEGFMDNMPYVGAGLRAIQNSAQRLEMLNRVVTALAAYRLTGDTEFAGKVIEDSHGNYTMSNAPRWMQGSSAARLLTQFRKFQLIQLSLLGRQVATIMNSADPKEKAAAWATLRWIATTHGIMAGGLGLPVISQALALLAPLFGLGGGDDEPEDVEGKLRKAIGNEDTSNLLLRGVPAWMGMNVSGKVGMGNTFSVFPFLNTSGQAGYEKALVGMGGAAVATGLNMAKGAALIRDGEYYKGLELMLPKGVRDAMRAGRFANEGITNRRGDVLMTPDELSLFDVGTQGLGLPSTKLQERQRRVGQAIEYDTFYKERTTALHDKYAKAYRAGDQETLNEVRGDWRDMGTAMRANGLKPPPMSALFKAPMEQRKRERNVIEGVQYTARTKKLVGSAAAV